MLKLIYDRHPTAKSAGGYEDLPFMWSYNGQTAKLGTDLTIPEWMVGNSDVIVQQDRRRLPVVKSPMHT